MREAVLVAYRYTHHQQAFLDENNNNTGGMPCQTKRCLRREGGSEFALPLFFCSPLYPVRWRPGETLMQRATSFAYQEFAP